MVVNSLRRSGAPVEHSPAEGQATYGMANLRTKDTGLPFIVFISQKDDASHAARVKWSPMPKARSSAMGSYAVADGTHKAGPRLAGPDERLIQQWILLNKDVLQGYWDGAIEYTQDAMEQLQKVP